MLDCRYYDVCCFTDGSCNGEQECSKREHCQFYKPMPDVKALLELADEIGRLHGRCDFCINRGECDWADEAICLEIMMDDFSDRIRKALVVER